MKSKIPKQSALMTVGKARKLKGLPPSDAQLKAYAMNINNVNQAQGQAMTNQGNIMTAKSTTRAKVIDKGTNDKAIAVSKIPGQEQMNLIYNMIMSSDSPQTLATPLSTLKEAYLGDRRAIRASASVK